MTFNLENAKTLLNHLKNLPDERFTYGYSMIKLDDNLPVFAKDLAHDCNTCGCVAGWTMALFNIESTSKIWISIEEKAGKILGIDEIEAGFLFNGDSMCGFECYSIFENKHEEDKQEAIRRLEYLVDYYEATSNKFRTN